jgi:hypothetical protein
MTEETKNSIRKMAEEAEMRVARSILRWKFKKEGKQLPHDNQLEGLSREVADNAHQVIVKRGKTILAELKDVYKKKI